MKKKLNNEPKFKVNNFLMLAEQYRIYATSDDDIAKIDMTDEFWRELDIQVRDDEIVIIQLNAKTRMSKSTTALLIGKELFKILIKHKKRENGVFGINNIARDQQEYSKLMRNPDTRNTVIVTDENNELESTGENVTVEKALNDVFSNVQAGRYVHRISCSPKGSLDPNTDIFLEVISVDRINYKTTCYLYYNMYKGGQYYRQLLGHVIFDVKDMLKNWVKVKDIFMKTGKTKKEKKLIEETRKKDFYVEYMIRKYEKMELITSEGILRPRILEYANVILEVEEELRDLAKFNILTRDTVKNFIKMYCRKNSIPTSIVGEELMTQEVIGILSLWKSKRKINEQIKKLIAKSGENSLDNIELLKNTEKKIQSTIHHQLNQLRLFKEINEKYNHVTSGENGLRTKQTD